MSALSSVLTAEASLLQTIRAATAALDGVGAAELNAALAELSRAAAGARTRLTAAADAARLSFSMLADDAALIASTLSADLLGTSGNDVPKSATPKSEAGASDAPASAPVPTDDLSQADPITAAVQPARQGDDKDEDAQQPVTVTVAANGPTQGQEVKPDGTTPDRSSLFPPTPPREGNGLRPINGSGLRKPRKRQ